MQTMIFHPLPLYDMKESHVENFNIFTSGHRWPLSPIRRLASMKYVVMSETNEIVSGIKSKVMKKCLVVAQNSLRS